MDIKNALTRELILQRALLIRQQDIQLIQLMLGTIVLLMVVAFFSFPFSKDTTPN